MLDKYLLCAPEDVQINDEFGVEAYKAFLRERWEMLKSLAIENLKVK